MLLRKISLWTFCDSTSSEIPKISFLTPKRTKSTPVIYISKPSWVSITCPLAKYADLAVSEFIWYDNIAIDIFGIAGAFMKLEFKCTWIGFT